LQQLGDHDLVARALDGSQDAYREIVLRYQKPVLSLLLRMVRQRELAEELAQEAFIKAFRALARFDASRRFSSWLFKIAHNTAIDHLRRSRLDTDSLDAETFDDGPSLHDRMADEQAAPPDEAVERRDLLQAIERAVARLRPDYREIVLLRFIQDFSYQEIAEILDLPLGTVKTNIHRARKELVALLEEDGFTP
jgi:RNA polymerase sigma-70 factor (ECF subfamily)